MRFSPKAPATLSHQRHLCATPVLTPPTPFVFPRSLSLAVDVLLLVHSHYSGSELLYSIDFDEGVDTLIPRQVMQVSNPTSAVEDLAIPDTNDVVLLRALR